METIIIRAADDAVIASTLALSFGLALLLERWCRSTLFRLMFSGVAKASRQNP